MFAHFASWIAFWALWAAVANEQTDFCSFLFHYVGRVGLQEPGQAPDGLVERVAVAAGAMLCHSNHVLQYNLVWCVTSLSIFRTALARRSRATQGAIFQGGRRPPGGATCKEALDALH